MPRKLLTLLFCLSLTGCMTTPTMDNYMARNIVPGMSEEELLKTQGTGTPMEMSLLPEGGKRITYYYVAQKVQKNMTGSIQNTSQEPKRLDVYLNSAGKVERHETVSDPSVEEALKLFSQANAANTRGDYKEALQILNNILEEKPHHILARTIRASIQTQLGNEAEAEKDYQVILQTDPNNSSVNHNLGIHYFKSGDYDIKGTVPTRGTG